ncbi:MAG: beta-lactamase family protein [Phycisphaerae bacterium]|nr:beta-lactamase family protein [Gemmatimonadaceae bacterium]
MSLCQTRCIITNFALLLVTSSLFAQSAPVPQLAPDFAAIDSFVRAAMKRDRVPGAALVITHHKDIVHVQGYGTDGYGRPVTPSTSFILGSLSKSFTSLAVMQLVEQGRVALDAPVQQYLPSFRVRDENASRTITVRHLLTHTSGIPTGAPQAMEAEATLQDHVRALAAVELSHVPGGAHEYASPNYIVVGAIVERVSGVPYAQYVQQHVFNALDMQHSFTDQTIAVQNGMSQGHRYWFGFPVAATLPYESDRMPTAALISTAGDLGHFMVAQLNAGVYADRSILSPAGVGTLHTPAAPGDGFSYAFGWRVSEMAGDTAVHHGGIVPNFRVKVTMLPASGWGVAVLTNVSTSLPIPVTPTSHRVADAIAKHLAGAPLADTGRSLSTIYLLITLGMFLILARQMVRLVRLDRWRARQANRSRAAVRADVALELLWPLAILFLLPRVAGFPWSEFFRGSPDVAWWLIAVASVGLITGLLKLLSLRAVRFVPQPANA